MFESVITVILQRALNSNYGLVAARQLIIDKKLKKISKEMFMAI